MSETISASTETPVVVTGEPLREPPKPSEPHEQIRQPPPDAGPAPVIEGIVGDVRGFGGVVGARIVPAASESANE